VIPSRIVVDAAQDDSSTGDRVRYGPPEAITPTALQEAGQGFGVRPIDGFIKHHGQGVMYSLARRVDFRRTVKAQARIRV
jgi:hypothetical protein